jgi:hypothetical protein
VGPPIGCPQLVSSASTLLSSVEGLDAVKHRRKTVFYIAVGTDVPISGPTDPCRAQAQGYIEDAIRFAQRANVNLYTFDPSGLRANFGGFDRRQIQFLQEAAENTGGRAIINTNEPAAHVAEVLEEARAYYLVAYELPARGADSRYHRIEVKVNRPGLEVHTRSTRFDPKAEGDGRQAAPPLDAAVAGVLPNADLGLAIGAASFAGQNGTARVAISLTGQFRDAVAGARDTLGLAVHAFTIDGQPVAAVDRSVPVMLEPAPPEAPGATIALKGPLFSAASEIALKPGTYSLRVGVKSAATGKTGSVYTDITVPDFLKEPLSLSGVVLTESSVSSVRGDPLTALEPTATRVFSADNRIQAFLRVYQGGTAALSPAALRIRRSHRDPAGAGVLPQPSGGLLAAPAACEPEAGRILAVDRGGNGEAHGEARLAVYGEVNDENRPRVHDLRFVPSACPEPCRRAFCLHRKRTASAAAAAAALHLRRRHRRDARHRARQRSQARPRPDGQGLHRARRREAAEDRRILRIRAGATRGAAGAVDAGGASRRRDQRRRRQESLRHRH